MKTKSTLISLLVRALAFTALWALISKNTWHDWPLIAGSIGAALMASFALWPVGAWRWRIIPLARFIPYFLWESITGGVDVARRAFLPRMPLDPAITEFPLRLNSEAAQVFFAWTVSLLPGTASVRLDGARLKIHVLDQQLPTGEKLRHLETRIAALFGEAIPPDDAGG